MPLTPLYLALLMFLVVYSYVAMMYLAARILGFEVPEMGFGVINFGKIKIRRRVFSIGLLPLSGWVRFEGMEVTLEENNNEPKPGNFRLQAFWKRVLILFSDKLIFAGLLLFGLFLIPLDLSLSEKVRLLGIFFENVWSEEKGLMSSQFVEMSSNFGFMLTTLSAIQLFFSLIPLPSSSTFQLIKELKGDYQKVQKPGGWLFWIGTLANTAISLFIMFKLLAFIFSGLEFAEVLTGIGVYLGTVLLVSTLLYFLARFMGQPFSGNKPV